MPEFVDIIDEQWMANYFRVLIMDVSEDDNSHPVSHNPEDPNDFMKLFDIITYQKAAIMVKMVHSIVGDDTLRNGLIRFMNRYQYRNANSSQFWEILTEETRRTRSNFVDLETIMDSWLHRTSYPIIQCHRTNETGRFILTQRAFEDQQPPAEGSNPTESTWWIPITVTSISSDLPLLWSSPDEPTVSVSLPVDNKTWFLVNAQSTGYYRVEYDEENWLLLADQLIYDYTVFSVATRMKLVDDAFHLAWTHVIPMRIAFRMIRYLRSVQDDQIRRIAVSYVTDIKKYFPSAIPDLDEYVSMISSNAVKAARLSDLPEEMAYQRPDVASGHPAVVP